METKALIQIERIEKRCLEGGLDPQQVKVAILKFFKLRWSFSTSLNIHNTYQASMARVYEQWKVKHATCKNVKGWDWSVQT
jgi:hypothetical protein